MTAGERLRVALVGGPMYDHLYTMLDPAAVDVVIHADLPDPSQVAAWYRDRVANLNELADAMHPFYSLPKPGAELLAQHLTEVARKALALLRDRLSDCPWLAADLGQVVKQTAAAAGLKMPQLAIPLRVVLLGLPQSPSIDSVLEVLGRERVLARLASALGG